jgi:hypothetical protein
MARMQARYSHRTTKLVAHSLAWHAESRRAGAADQARSCISLPDGKLGCQIKTLCH